MTYNDFKREVLNLNGPRVHKITNSIGVYDAYKWIRKNKWLDIGSPVSEHDFYKIIRGINDQLIIMLLRGESIRLPYKIGMIEIRKSPVNIDIKDGKLKVNAPIDWDKTLKLWYEDEESFNKKTLVKVEDKEIFQVHYNKAKSAFKNKAFYQFRPNRDLKMQLKHKIKEGTIDAYNLL